MTVYDEPVLLEDAPSFKAKLSKYERVLVPLMDTPGSWGEIGEYKSESSAYQAALNLRKGKYKIPGEPSSWEFAYEGNHVYAQYLNGAG